MLILPLIIISAAAGYYLANQFTNLAYDKSLYRTALALADQVSLESLGVQVNLPEIAKDLLEYDEDDDIYFRIIGPAGDLVAANNNLPLPKIYPAADKYLYYDAQIKDATEPNYSKLRVVVYALPLSIGTAINSHKNVYVMVGETLQKRTQMANEIMFSMLIPQIIIVSLVSALLFFGIRRGLRPLDKLKLDLSQRNINDLSPLDNTGAPTELQPLLHSFNDLLTRVSGTIAKQQRFIADASHQLKTPLAGLKMQAELAIREHEPSKISHALNQINDASGNLSHLVSQLLSLTKAEPDGAIFLDFKPVDLCQLAQKVTADWVVLALQKNIDLGFYSSLKVATVKGNETLLRELMNNLIDNAIRYTPAGGKITVGIDHEAIKKDAAKQASSKQETLKQPSQKIFFYVQDNGIGIAADNQSRVFERFYRVLGTQQAGCGLGLNIVQEIAQRHDATVSLVSEGETNEYSQNKGTIISVCFTAIQINSS